MDDGLQVLAKENQLRVCDIVAKCLEDEAHKLPPSMKEVAAQLRKRAKEWRECCAPPYQKIVTELDS